MAHWLNGTMRKYRSRQAPKPTVTGFVTSRYSSRGPFDRKSWRVWQQGWLEVAWRPAMLAQSMRRVGLIDTMVGNACASAHRNVPPRDAARRTTSLRNARAAGDNPAPLARLTRTVTLYCTKGPTLRPRGLNVRRRSMQKVNRRSAVAVCTENLNPNVVMVKCTQDGV